MGTIIISTLQRGGAGTSPFPTTRQEDAALPHVTAADQTAREAIEEWRRVSFMTCYQIDNQTTYRLGVDTTIGGQVWTPETVGTDYQLLSEKNQPSGYVGLNVDGFIDPEYIRSVYVQEFYVVANEAERLALTALTGDIAHQLDNNQVYLKKNNNTPPTTNADWADITTASQVSSVNGMVGAVSIDINGLLGWANNQTEFNAAVLATPAIGQLNGQVAINTSDIANIYALLSGITGEADSLPVYSPTTQYATGNVVLYDAGSGRKNLYRCTAPPAISTAPTNIAFWEPIGDFYTRAEIDTMMAAKADLVNGTVPLNQLDLNAINKYYVVADLAERNTLQPSLDVDDRVMVMEAISADVPDGGAAEYVYKPGDANADGLGFVFFSSATSDAFNWNRPVKKVPVIGQTIGGDSIEQGLEEAYFGAVIPRITYEDIAEAEVGSSAQANIQGLVSPEEADTIDEIRIIRQSDDATITTVTPATPPTPTTISYAAPSVTMLNGVTESYRIEVDYTIGADSGTIVSDVKPFTGVYPILIGNGAAGLTGSQIYALSKLVEPQGNKYYNGYLGSERLYFAVPNTMDALISIVDQHKDEVMNSLFPDTPAVVSISSTGLAADWTQDYKVYQSNYDVITNNERYGFLFAYEDESKAENTEDFKASDRIKLDSIEFGAEQNPNALEVKTLYESNANTNAFDDGEKTKLAGIQAGAQVNQDDATVKAQYENNADTNAYTDVDKAKLDGLDVNAIGDMKQSDFAAVNPAAAQTVNRAIELVQAGLNQTATLIPAGRYLTITDVNESQGYVVVKPADNTLNDIVNAVADEDIPASGFGRIGIISYNNNIDTTGTNFGDPVYLGQNGTAVFTAPTSGSLVQVGLVYKVGNPGVVASREYRDLLRITRQENWRPNTFYPKHTLVLADDPNIVAESYYFLRAKTDLISQGVLDPGRVGFFDDWEIAGGDMKAVNYDPNLVGGDVFLMDNMNDGVNKVAMTIGERNKLANLEDPNFKGYFNTPNELNTIYPTGQAGWSAIVVFENDGTTPNGNLWNWQDLPTPQWVDTGITGIGGDMNTGTYDPTSVVGDAFLMDNFSEGSNGNKRFFDDARKAKIDAFSPATSYYLKTDVDGLLALKGDLTYINAQDNLRMLISVYDPTAVAGDVFDMDNMVEGATNKILTQAERDNITQNTTDRHTHANKALLDTITDVGDGEAYLANDGNYRDVAKAGIHNGTCIEQQDIFIVEQAGQVYADVEKRGGGDLQVYFGNNSYFLNCTSGGGVNGRARIQLTAGTALVAQDNLLVVELVGGVPQLRVEPDVDSLPTEYAWVALIAIRDAANVAIEGPLVLQRFTDAATHNDRGRIGYLGERLRVEGSKWWLGVEPTVTITPNPSALDSVGFSILAGIVYQLHRQSFPALDIASAGIYVTGINNSGSLQKYDKVLNLNAVNEYADGTTIADGDYFNLVVFGAINKEPSQCKLFVNPSAGGYSTANAAYNDKDNLANLSVPEAIRTVGFLIARIPLQYTSANNGTYTFINPAGKPQWIDLRGETLDVRDESGTGSSTINTAADVVYDNTTSGLTATNVQSAIDAVVAAQPSFLLGTGWTETTHTQAVTTTWAELTAPLAISAVATGVAIKSGYRIGHNVTGTTYRCTVTVQATFTKAINEFVSLGLGKNGTRIVEGYAEAFSGGNQDTTEHSITATYTVDITDTDEIAAFVRGLPLGASYDIDAVQITVTGFKV